MRVAKHCMHIATFENAILMDEMWVIIVIAFGAQNDKTLSNAIIRS